MGESHPRVLPHLATRPRRAPPAPGPFLKLLPTGRAASRTQVNRPGNLKAAAKLFLLRHPSRLLLDNPLAHRLGPIAVADSRRSATFGFLTLDELARWSLKNQDLHHCGSGAPLFFYAFRVTDPYDTPVKIGRASCRGRG